MTRIDVMNELNGKMTRAIGFRSAPDLIVSDPTTIRSPGFDALAINGPCRTDSGQGRINHSGPPYQRKAGPFSRTRIQDFLIYGVHFFPKKVDDLFLVVVTFKRTLNVQTSKQRGKNLAADRRGPSCDGGPSHGTTGTMDNPAPIPDRTKSILICTQG